MSVAVSTASEIIAIHPFRHRGHTVQPRAPISPFSVVLMVMLSALCVEVSWGKPLVGKDSERVKN
jgi:hypothetical protein